jgi:hypothetical protein
VVKKDVLGLILSLWEAVDRLPASNVPVRASVRDWGTIAKGDVLTVLEQAFRAVAHQ